MTGWRAYLALDDDALLGQCEVDRFRASGPGGQHRNKTDTAVRLRHRPSGLEATAVETRSQHENRAMALSRLRVALAVALREPVDLEAYTPPPPLAATMRGARISVSQKNPRYPEVVGAVFDLLEAAGWRVSEAAEVLPVSTTALGRFLEADPVLFRAANARRQALGLPPLRGRA